MNFKLVFLLVAVYSTNQVNAAPKLNNWVDDIIEFAAQVLLSTNELISDAVNSTIGLIYDGVNGLDQLRADAVTLTEQLVQRENALINTLIDAVKNRTNESGVVILDCIESVETEINDLQIQALNFSSLCINSAIVNATTVFVQILDDVNDINVNFKEPEKKLEECKGTAIPLICIEMVLKELGEIAATVPAKVIEEEHKALQSLDALDRAVEICVRDAADGTKEGSIGVFNDFSQCVWDKEHNGTIIKH